MVLNKKLSFIFLCLASFTLSGQKGTDFQAVSIVDLHINPEAHKNKVVHVVGYLSDIPMSLHISKEHSKLSIGGDSIKVVDSTVDGDLINSKCLDKYVSIVGKLKKSDPKRNNSEYYYLSDLINVKTAEQGYPIFCYQKNK